MNGVRIAFFSILAVVIFAVHAYAPCSSVCLMDSPCNHEVTAGTQISEPCCCDEACVTSSDSSGPSAELAASFSVLQLQTLDILSSEPQAILSRFVGPQGDHFSYQESAPPLLRRLSKLRVFTI